MNHLNGPAFVRSWSKTRCSRSLHDEYLQSTTEELLLSNVNECVMLPSKYVLRWYGGLILFRYAGRPAIQSCNSGRYGHHMQACGTAMWRKRAEMFGVTAL